MKKLLPVFLAVLCFCGSVSAAKEEEAVGSLLKSKVDEILSILNEKNISREERKQKVTDAATPLFDIPLMAKLILGRTHWAKLNEKEREKFTDLFVKLTQATYFDKLDLLAEDKIEYDKPVKEKEKIRATTYVVSKDQRLAIVYKFYKAPEAWKVYDVEIEGISIVKSYGSQYDEFLKTGNLDGLLAKMRAKIQEFEKKAEPKSKTASGNSKKEKAESKAN